jgi:signal transduction histidine kinase
MGAIPTTSTHRPAASDSTASRVSDNPTCKEAFFLIQIRSNQIMAVSENIRDVLGYNPSTLIGRSFSELHAPSLQLMQEELRSQVLPESGQPLILNFFTTRGSLRALQVRYDWLVNAADDIKMLILSDSEPAANPTPIQETLQRHSPANETTSALANLPTASGLDETFLSKISHQLRSPLGVTLSSAGILSRYEKTLSAEERQDYLNAIIDSVRSMHLLLEDIVWLGRLQLGAIPLAPGIANLPALCHEVVEEARSASGKPIPILFTHQPQHIPILCDQSLLRLALTHILSNALKFSHNGDSIQFKLSCDDAHAYLTISDHGIGIPEMDLKKLFTPFHRGSNVGDIHGNGIGLTIAWHCIKLHGGEIQATSVAGHGSTFQITLPLSHSPAKPDNR